MKPGRPFGLSLAILASTLIFSVLPLLQVAVVVLLQARLDQATENFALAEGVAPIAVGGDFTGVSTATLIAQTMMGTAFLVIAIFAWLGRPPFIRRVMIGAVLVLTAIQTLITAGTLFTPTDFSAGIDSGGAVVRPLLWLRLLLIVFIPLYVLWYMNRGPARAFYRGYYLADPISAKK